MTRQFVRMLSISLLPMAGAWLACTDLSDFEGQGFGGATASSSTSAGSGGIECDVFDTVCSGTCVNLDSDPTHCGACGHGCQGGECQSGACQPILLAVDAHMGDLALDATNVYWTNSQGAVKKVAIDGGDPITILEGGDNYISIDVDANNLYLLRGVDWELVQMPIGGGAKIVLIPGGPDHLQRFLVGPTHIYYTTLEATSAVWKVPIGVSSPTLLTLGTDPPTWWPQDLALMGSTLFWTHLGSTDFPNGLVQSLPIGGGDPTTLATEQGYPLKIWALGANLYWLNYHGDDGSKAVNTMPIGGGTPTTVLSGFESNGDMAIDATGFYWIVDDGNYQDRLMKAPMGGGEPSTLVEMMNNPSNIHLDATTIYWRTWDFVEGEGRIMKLAK